METKKTIHDIPLEQKRIAEGLIRAEIATGNSLGDRSYELRKIFEAWTDGLNGAIPKQFEPYFEKAEAMADPEYAEYQRLRKKFGPL